MINGAAGGEIRSIYRINSASRLWLESEEPRLQRTMTDRSCQLEAGSSDMFGLVSFLF